ncbi:hypothetical protein C8J57DRAFT_625168 [Mycena rebaudengoi]|nr:hypothetical protein C8J57DRAFT_625168 [Mycena rebaudengoi]
MSIQTCPTEILLKIFDFAAGDDPLQLGGTAVAIPISQTSQDWRRIALDYPALWDDVRISHGAYFHRTMLDSFMARSSTLPLTVVFAVHPHQSSPTFDDFLKVFITMKDYCSRIRKMYAMLPSGGLGALNSIMCRESLPLLVHLHVLQLDGGEPREMKFHSTPLLAVIHIQRVFYDLRGHKGSELRSARLVEVPILCIPSNLMQDLQDLATVRTSLPSFLLGPLPRQLNLTSLILDEPLESRKFLRSFFGHFKMPRLNRLEVARLDEESSFQFINVVNTRVHLPSLRSLTLTSLALVGIEPGFCQAMPALEVLALRDVDPEPLFALFQDHPSIFPTLRSVSVDGVDHPLRGG